MYSIKMYIQVLKVNNIGWKDLNMSNLFWWILLEEIEKEVNSTRMEQKGF